MTFEFEKNMQFSSALFWDIKENQLSHNKNAHFLIRRVLICGRWQDWISYIVRCTML